MFILTMGMKCRGNLHLNASELVGHGWVSCTVWLQKHHGNLVGKSLQIVSKDFRCVGKEIFYLALSSCRAEIISWDIASFGVVEHHPLPPTNCRMTCFYSVVGLYFFWRIKEELAGARDEGWRRWKSVFPFLWKQLGTVNIPQGWRCKLLVLSWKFLATCSSDQ